jgi:hypothetical protein
MLEELTIKDIPIDYLLDKSSSFFDSDEYYKAIDLFNSLKYDDSTFIDNIGILDSNQLIHLRNFIYLKYLNIEVDLNNNYYYIYFKFKAIKIFNDRYKLLNDKSYKEPVRNYYNLSYTLVMKRRIDYSNYIKISYNSKNNIDNLYLEDKKVPVISRDNIVSSLMEQINFNKTHLNTKFIQNPEKYTIMNRIMDINKYIFSTPIILPKSVRVSTTYNKYIKNVYHENLNYIRDQVYYRYKKYLDLKQTDELVYDNRTIISNLLNKFESVYDFTIIHDKFNSNRISFNASTNYIVSANFNQIYIYDVSGNLIKDYVLTLNGNTIIIDFDSEIEGYYFIPSVSNILHNLNLADVCETSLEPHTYLKILYSDNYGSEIDIYYTDIDKGLLVVIYDEKGIRYDNYTIVNINSDMSKLYIEGNYTQGVIYIIPTINYMSNNNFVIISDSTVLSLMNNFNFLNKEYDIWKVN